MNHLGGYLTDGDANTFMPDVWQALIDAHDVQSVIDVGCGAGVNLQWFAERGIRTTGIEGHPEAVAIARSKGLQIVSHDFTIARLEMGAYDLGICTEFAEHVAQEFEDNWMPSLIRCRFVLFTHALPGQGGYHHVNCQTSEYWIKRFSDYGFEIDEAMTARFRDPSAIWGRNTLTIFR